MATNRLLARLMLFALAVFALVGPALAQIPGQSERAKRLGKRLMCMCGCNQVLGECNHVGCSVSTAMLQKLDERIARNESDDLILQSFVQEYGQKVLSHPPSSGFGLSAWVMPFAALLVGGVVCWVFLRRWRTRPAAAAVPGGGSVDVTPEFLEKARRDTDLDFDWNPSGGEKKS